MHHVCSNRMISRLCGAVAALLLFCACVPAHAADIWWCEADDGSYFKSSRNYPGLACEKGKSGEPPEIDTSVEASPQEHAACRKSFTAACLVPIACEGAPQGCVRYECDPIPTAAKAETGEPIDSQLWYFSRGGDGGAVKRGDELPHTWFGGPGESQNGPGMILCGQRYEARAVIHALKQQTGIALPPRRSAGKNADAEDPQIVEHLKEAERKYAVELFSNLDKGGVCAPVMPAIQRRFPEFELRALYYKLAVMFVESRQKPASQYCLGCVAKAMNTSLGIKVSEQLYAKLLSSNTEFKSFLEQLGLASCPARQPQLVVQEPPVQHGTQQMAARLPAPAPAAAPRGAAPSNQECLDKVIAIHRVMDQESRAARGNAAAETAVLDRANQQQLDLFTGACAHHPNAASYVGNARKHLAQSGRAADADAGAVHRMPAGSGDVGESGNRRYVGEITQHCVRYRPLHTTSTASWYELSNGCSSTIKVWHSSFSPERLSALSVIKAGQSTKSWFNPKTMRGIRYVGCRETSDGKTVHLDEKLNRCFIVLQR